MLLNEVLRKCGSPFNLHSDQGINYESSIIAELCDLLKIRKTRPSPKHPSGNSQVDRLKVIGDNIWRNSVMPENKFYFDYLRCNNNCFTHIRTLNYAHRKKYYESMMTDLPLLLTFKETTLT